MRSILCDINIHHFEDAQRESAAELRHIVDATRLKRNFMTEQQKICKNLEAAHKVKKQSGFAVKYGIVNDILYGGVSSLDQNANSVYRQCKKLSSKPKSKKSVSNDLVREKKIGVQIDIQANLTRVSSNTQRYERDYSFLRDCYNVFGKFHQQLKLM